MISFLFLTVLSTLTFGSYAQKSTQTLYEQAKLLEHHDQEQIVYKTKKAYVFATAEQDYEIKLPKLNANAYENWTIKSYSVAAFYSEPFITTEYILPLISSNDWLIDSTLKFHIASHMVPSNSLYTIECEARCKTNNSIKEYTVIIYLK